MDEEEGDKTIPKKKKVEKTEETVIVKSIILNFCWEIEFWGQYVTLVLASPYFPLFYPVNF